MFRLNRIITSVFAVFSCACSSHPELQEFESQTERAIGKEAFAFLEKADKVSVMKVNRESKDSYVVVSDEKQLTDEQVAALRDFLLKDTSYHFERRKKCLFVPEYAYKFQGKNKEMVVLISFSCPQVKFLLNQHAVIIDHDPVAAKMEAFTKNLIGE